MDGGGPKVNGVGHRSRSSSLQPPPYQQQQQGHQGQGPEGGIVDVSLLQPRVAVVLGVPKHWHLLLTASRLLSMMPTLWWGIRCALRLLILQILDIPAKAGNGEGVVGRVGAAQVDQPGIPMGAGAGGLDVGIGERGGSIGGAGVLFQGLSRLITPEASLKLVETVLAIIWSCASAYLAFFFTDRLMSRWLINYTPMATVIRLCTVCACFAYATSWFVYLTGGADDPSLLLPSWIVISALLTACYAYSQRKITIRKETRLTIRVFSVASFISMVSLLTHSHLVRAAEIYGGANNIPLVAIAMRCGVLVRKLLVLLLGVRTD